MLKPAPVTLPALMVSAAVPEEVSVTDCVAGVFRSTLPKAMLFDPRVSAAVTAFNVMPKVFATPPAVAVNTAVCVELTAEMFAVKPALLAPAGTVTEVGTVKALLLLDRLTASPPVPAAPDRLTVQASLPAPVIVALLQDSAPGVAEEELVLLPSVAVKLENPKLDQSLPPL